MSVNQQRNKFLDALIWLLVIVGAVAAVAANIRYASVSPALRLTVGIIIAIVLLTIAFQTNKGLFAWKYLKEARDEIRRVVWPTRQTTIQIALVVAAMVAVAAVIIFVFDQLFLWLIAWLTGQRG
ncbi:MAG: preprotein translocase subunit SecE [Pseudomonadota bacterium]